MEFVNSFLGCIGPCVLDSIKVRYGYLKHYDDNIGKLDGQVATLEAKEMDVLQAIQAAKRNGEEIQKSVQLWITSVDRVKEEARKFLADNVQANKRCFKGWFPNMRTLYRLSREAESKHEAIARLCEEQEKFDIKFSLPTPPLGLDSITSKGFVPFQTTKLAMEKVMDALKEDSVDFVGIHGMGGVGKTTLVHEIGRKSKEEGLFDNVVIAVVSQTVHIESIQEQIAELLGLKLEEKSVIARASRLCDRLKQDSKILVILDDVWAELDIAKISIPSGEDHKGCKVVITTRRSQVCTAMGRSVQARRIIGLDVLTEQESWDLFKLQVGDIIESPTTRSVAKEVVKECGRLPVALVTVGKAMRGKDVEEWKEAALELKKSKPVNIEGMDENVFKCIKFSYDYLRNEEAKACFLLCCLFPEDYEIETETLVRYGVGLNTFDGIDKIQEARRRAHSTINNLKASSLLVAGTRRGRVKMHDVVRDVAKEIASDRYYVRAGERLKEWPNELRYNGVGGISLMGNEIRHYPDALECPNLEIFLMQNNKIEREMPEEVFRGMKRLRVFDQSLEANSSDISHNRGLVQSVGYLESLQTLIIDSVPRGSWNYGRYYLSIWGISGLGELKMLQVLSLRHCTFEEPLNALRKMKNLRLLDLAFSKNCSSLFNFAEDCNFPQLEELYLTERMSCSIAEVMKCCPRLNVLWFCMHDMSQIPDNFVFPHLDHFYIDVAKYHFKFEADYFENTLYLDSRGRQLDDEALPNCIGTLLPSVSIMTLCYFNGLRNILPSLVVAEDSLTVLKKLDVEKCDELEYLINIEENSKIPQPTCFSSVEELRLLKLRSFRGLCGMVIVSYIPYAFLKLRELQISDCPKMSDIGAPLNLLRRMRQLEVLGISNCKALEYLFDLKEEAEDAVEEEEGILANLTRLRLDFLSNLEELWKGRTGLVHLGNLKTVDIFVCRKLKVVFRWSVAQRLEKLQELSVKHCDELEDIVGRETGEEAAHEGPTGLLHFRSLEKVDVDGCPKLKVVFHWSVTQRLEQLQELKVWNCKELEEIVGWGKKEEAVHKGLTGLLPFHNLKTMDINSCGKLKVLFHWSVTQRLEQLQELHVWHCKELEEIVGWETGEEAVHKGPTGLVSFHNLTKVKIGFCPKLKVLFHWFVAQRLEQLQQLTVRECGELENIVGRENGEEAIHKVIFPELEDLTLRKLPKLIGFYTGNLPGCQSTPKLKTVRISNFRKGEVEIPVDGRKLESVIKDHKELLVRD